MNSEFNEWLRSPAPATPAVAEPIAPGVAWREWARRLLVCNPFFLGSAALLLLGVLQLSRDPNFLNAESAKLLFNYGALQLYEVLVVVAALVLARRKTWYDSALLVVVEHGLVFVPFLLISQASLISPALGAALAAGAALLAGARAAAIRRGYPLFNLPPRALLLGAVFLVLNTALPIVFRAQIDEWQEKWAVPNVWLWYGALPLLVLGANLLPRPARYGGLNPERHWLPLFLYALWVVATGAHFWCLAYVSDQPFHIYQLGPAAFAAAWTLWRRIPDCVPQPGARWEMAMLGVTFVAPLVAIGWPALFELLVLLNVVAYAVLLTRRGGPQRAFLRDLLIGCAALLVFGLPREFTRELLPHITRAHALLLAFATYAGLHACRSRRMSAGFAGACAAGICVAVLWRTPPLHGIVEAMTVFLLAHSLVWKRDDAVAALLRTMAGMAWIADALLWVHAADWRIDMAISSAALGLLVAWWLAARWTQRRDWIVLVSALGVLFIAPGDWLLRRGSPGLVALAASFTTFAIGVGVAWTRHLWDRIHGLNR